MIAPYALVKMTIDGGGPVSGGQIVSGGNVIQLFGESTAHWETSLWEIYEYPDGFALPSGWQDIEGIYRYEGVVPPAFTIDAVANWGKYFFRLTVNEGKADGVFHGPSDPEQPLVDNRSGLSVLSTNGFHDVGYGEATQFDVFRQSIGELKITLRAIDAMGGGSGGGLPGGSNGQFQYKNGALFAGASGFIYDSGNNRAQAVASLAIKNSANALQAIIAATAQTVADHTFTIPNVASDTFALLAATQTLTNKTINATNNSIVGTGADVGDILVFDGSKFSVFDAHSKTDGTYFGIEGGVVGFYAPAGSGGASVGTNTVQISDGSGGFLSAANATYGGGFLSLATALKLTNSGHATSLASGTLAADVAVTLPAATTRLMGFDTTDAMTHKTYDVEGAGNVLTAASAGSGSLLVFNGSRYVAFPIGAIAGQLLAVNPTLDGYVFVNPSGGGGGGGTLPNFVSVSGTTIGATSANLVLPDATEIVLNDNTAYSLYVDIIGQRTDAPGDARKHVELLVRVASGVITVEDQTTLVDAANGMTWTYAFTDAGSRKFRVTATGTTGQTISYTAFITTGGPMVGAGGSGATSDGPITMLQTSNGTGGFTGASGFFAGSGNVALAAAASYGGGTRVFQLGAATANPSTSPSSGAVFYIDAADGYLKLKKSNGQVVALGASSGDPAILAQATWFIDPSAGNDNDTGLSGHPLQTWAELTRRWGVGAVLNPAGGTCTVKLMGALPSSDAIRLPAHLRLGVDCVLNVDGTRTTVRSGTLTAVTTINRATSVPWDATDSALGSGGAWTANLSQRVRITAGGNLGQTMWVAKDLGSKKARLSAPATIPNDGTLHVTQGTISTDAYTVETLSDVYIDEVALGGQWTFSTSGSIVVFSNLNVKGTITQVSACPDTLVLYSGCSFETCVAQFPGSSGATFLNCAFLNPVEGLTIDGAEANIEGGLLKSGVLTVLNSAAVTLDADVLIQGGAVNVGNNSTVSLGRCGIFDSAGDAFTVGISDTTAKKGGTSTARLQTGVFSSHALYGSGNTGVGLVVGAGALFLYETTVPVIAGASDFKVGGATSGFGFDMTTGLYVGPTTFTWAHLATAIGVGTGFGDNAHNPDKNAHVVKES